MQAGAARDAQKQSQKQFDYAQTILAPFENYGTQAAGNYANLLGIYGPDKAAEAMSAFKTSPGYQFSLDQGLRAVEAGQAARGMLRSGATLKAEQAFGTGLADQEFGNYVNRLFDLSRLGESAGTGTGNIAGSSAQAALNSGSALSSIYGNAAGGIGRTANSLFSDTGFQNWASGLFGGGGSSPFGATTLDAANSQAAGLFGGGGLVGGAQPVIGGSVF